MSLIDHALRTAEQTRAVVMGRNVLGRTGPLFGQMFPGKRVLVVADENTYRAAGPPVVASLVEAGVTLASEPLIFPGTPTLYADYTNVERIRERLRALGDTVICSIASGTLNDLAKLASGELGRPYLNVCTAASVDGYTAFGAAITRDGFKITRACPAPVAIVADIDVIAKAPQTLTATGYGDLIEKIPAGADWILADELGIEPIDPTAWGLVQDPLRQVLDQPERIARAEADAIADMLEALLLSGLAMQAVKSSRPASGAGHQFSHVWEMEGYGLDTEPPLSHGFKVAVGTVASCAAWEEALRLDIEALDVDRVVATAPSAAVAEAHARSSLPSHVADIAVDAVLAKNLRGDALRDRLLTIQRAWPAIRTRVATQLVSADEAARMLRAAGAPYQPGMIGMSLERLAETYFSAQMIRTRYTVLDLLADLGVLEGTVARMFGPGGHWGRRPAADGIGEMSPHRV